MGGGDGASHHTPSSTRAASVSTETAAAASAASAATRAGASSASLAAASSHAMTPAALAASPPSENGGHTASPLSSAGARSGVTASTAASTAATAAAAAGRARGSASFDGSFADATARTATSTALECPSSAATMGQEVCLPAEGGAVVGGEEQVEEEEEVVSRSDALHHPCHTWHGCAAYGVVERKKYGLKGCARCNGGALYHSCCGGAEGSEGCAMTAEAVAAAAAAKDPSTSPSKKKKSKKVGGSGVVGSGVAGVEGRWRSTTYGPLSVRQHGRTFSVLCPAAPWSPTTGVASAGSVSVLNATVPLCEEKEGGGGMRRPTLRFASGDVWTWESQLDAKAEALRNVLCEFFDRRDRSQLRNVDWLVERYRDKKIPLRNYILELFRGDDEAVEHLDTLFGTAPRWWVCTACHNVMTAVVFRACAVCGSDRSTAKSFFPQRTDNVNPYFRYDARHAYKLPARTAPPEPEPPAPTRAELTHQLSPSLLSIGVLQSDVHSAVKKGWHKTTRPVARRYLAARRGKVQRDRSQSPTLTKLGAYPTIPVLDTLYRTGDLVLYKIKGVPHQARVVSVVEVQPIAYIILLPDGKETSCTEAELQPAPKSSRRDRLVRDNRGLPDWHPSAIAAEGRLDRRSPPPAHPSQTRPPPPTMPEVPPAGSPERWEALAEAGLTFTEESGSEEDAGFDASRRRSEGSSTDTRVSGDGGVWICFDCDFKRNPADVRECVACERPRNVGSWQRFKKRQGSTAAELANLPVPARVYTPPREPDSFQAYAVALHNRYRASHRAPAVVYCLKLALNAQKQAEYCARLIGLSHGHNEGEGQNTFMSGGLDSYNPKKILDIAAAAWYREKTRYEKCPGLTGLRSGAGHFTQMVWKDTTRLGAGIAWAGSRAYVVVNYYPPGNDATDPAVLGNVTLPVDAIDDDDGDDDGVLGVE